MFFLGFSNYFQAGSPARNPARANPPSPPPGKHRSRIPTASPAKQEASSLTKLAWETGVSNITVYYKFL